jgi:hypothetical protein
MRKWGNIVQVDCFLLMFFLLGSLLLISAESDYRAFSRFGCRSPKFF